jgi:hypothetical protein
MKQCNITTKPADAIHLAFDSATLESLIRDGKLHASDFNCLDKSSKRGVWSLLRSVAADKIKS